MSGNLAFYAVNAAQITKHDEGLSEIPKFGNPGPPLPCHPKSNPTSFPSNAGQGLAEEVI
jgi:hypothetical protein